MSSSIWFDTSKKFYHKYNILDCPHINDTILDYLKKYTKDKHVVDLGCGPAIISKQCGCSRCTLVDPFPLEDLHLDIIKMGGVEYLSQQKENQFDTILCLFSIHHMNLKKLLEEVSRTIRSGGHLIAFSMSRHSDLFGNNDFNQLFTKYGFNEKEEYDDILHVSRPISYKLLKNAIYYRSWSNLRQLNDTEIMTLINYIPKDISSIKCSIGIRKWEFN